MAKILIIDDSKFFLKTSSIVLEKAGHTVFTAMDGDEALQKVKEEKPDLIITDNEMPNKNGYELIKELKENPDTKNIPIIMSSGTSKEELIKEIGDPGADDYITKPFKPEEIQEKVNSLLSGKK